jgi:hypothetical protein
MKIFKLVGRYPPLDALSSGKNFSSQVGATKEKDGYAAT